MGSGRPGRCVWGLRVGPGRTASCPVCRAGSLSCAESLQWSQWVSWFWWESLSHEKNVLAVYHVSRFSESLPPNFSKLKSLFYFPKERRNWYFNNNNKKAPLDFMGSAFSIISKLVFNQSQTTTGENSLHWQQHFCVVDQINHCNYHCKEIPSYLSSDTPFKGKWSWFFWLLSLSLSLPLA